MRYQLILAADAAELHSLRWETLRDPNRPDAPLLTAGAQVLFLRHLNNADWRPVRQATAGAVRALVLLANPSDLPDYGLTQFDQAAEGTLIAESLGAIPTSVLAIGQANLDSLVQHLYDGYEILYILAHGRTVEVGEAWLYLEAIDGSTAPVPGGDLASRIDELITPLE